MRFVESGDLLFRRFGDRGTGLRHKLVDPRPFFKLPAEILLAHTLRLQRLAVVLFAADLRDDLFNLGVDIRGGYRHIEFRSAVKQQFRADRLLQRLLLKLRKILLHLFHRHSVVHVETHQTVQFETDRLAGYLHAVHESFFHFFCLSVLRIEKSR